MFLLLVDDLKNFPILQLYFLLILLINTPATGQHSESFGDQLIIGIIGKAPQVINPFVINNFTEKHISRLIYGTGIIQSLDRYGQIINLVESYIPPKSSREQGLKWQYNLRRNIIFHNGRSLRNYDVEFTFDILKKFGGGIINKGYDFSNIASINLIGDLEFIFNLKNKDNFFDEKFSDIPILSRYYYTDLIDDGYEIFKSNPPLGYGPFQLESKSEMHISLVSHKNYVFGEPYLARIVFKFFNNEQQMLDSFIKGDVDFIEVSTPSTARRLHQILSNRLRVFVTPRPEKKVYFLMFNVNQFPFDDTNVRKALNGAINQGEIAKALLESHGHVALSILDDRNGSFIDRLFSSSFQPKVSLESLQKNGWQINESKGILAKDGKDFNFELLFEENSFMEENIARSVKIQLAELGINVQPRPVNFFEKNTLIEENKFAAIIKDFSYYEDYLYEGIKAFYFTELRKNDSPLNYSNPTIDRLIKLADLNPELRKQFIQKFQIELYRESPVIFLFFNDEIIYAVNQRFQKVYIPRVNNNRLYYLLNPFENWFVPKSLQKY